MGSRPEYQAPPEVFYDAREARKYTRNSRVSAIQARMTERAVELLNLPRRKRSLLLDVGCGSGLSGAALSAAGHEWVGLDIARAMLDVAADADAEGDLLHADMGAGLPFRPGAFDGAVSISAVQWLCNQDRRDHRPVARLRLFFATLYAALARGARAVLQFYPENAEQMQLIVDAALRSGFSGGVVVDYPNSARAKKYYLCLNAGVQLDLPRGLDGDAMAEEVSSEAEEEEEEEDEKKKEHLAAGRGRQGRNLPRSVELLRERRGRDAAASGRRSATARRPVVKSREWIQQKKERQRRQGRDVRPDSRFTGRKRKPRF
jgi:18S rRNA (guanine1575-N7)-methyltransferase